MLYMGLIRKNFYENLTTEKFPSHVITVRKEDLSNLKQIYFRYDIREVNLTGFSTIDLSKLVLLRKFYKFF